MISTRARIARICLGLALLMAGVWIGAVAVAFFCFLPPEIRSIIQNSASQDTYTVFIFGMPVHDAWLPYTGWIAGLTSGVLILGGVATLKGLKLR